LAQRHSKIALPVDIPKLILNYSQRIING
jgi:hypothetical protein